MIEQDDLNAEMTELGLGRYNAQVESARKYEQNARSKAGQRLMRELLPKFYERVEEMIARTEGRPTRWLNDLKNYSAKDQATMFRQAGGKDKFINMAMQQQAKYPRGLNFQ